MGRVKIVGRIQGRVTGTTPIMLPLPSRASAFPFFFVLLICYKSATASSGSETFREGKVGNQIIRVNLGQVGFSHGRGTMRDIYIRDYS